MDAYIAELKQRLDLPNQSYFKALEEGAFDKEDFIETQIQFLFAVVFFSRPMAVLAARLPRPEMRVNVIHNVVEEHGEGNLKLSHEKTFLTLLAGLGVGPEDIESRALWPEVRAFNTILTGLTNSDDVFTGVAVLGIIEDLFAGFSARLGRGILKNGWIAEEALVHYGTHEELDEEHADEFYQIIRPFWDKAPRHRYQIEQGLELGAYVFTQLYRGLYEARARRTRRTVTGPHSLAEGWFLEDEWMNRG